MHGARSPGSATGRVEWRAAPTKGDTGYELIAWRAAPTNDRVGTHIVGAPCMAPVHRVLRQGGLHGVRPRTGALAGARRRVA